MFLWHCGKAVNASDAVMQLQSICKFTAASFGFWHHSPNISWPRKQSSCGQHGAHLGPVGPRWAPCWPHEPCYQGVRIMSDTTSRSGIDVAIQHHWVPGPFSFMSIGGTKLIEISWICEFRAIMGMMSGLVVCCLSSTLGLSSTNNYAHTSSEFVYRSPWAMLNKQCLHSPGHEGRHKNFLVFLRFSDFKIHLILFCYTTLSEYLC